MFNTCEQSFIHKLSFSASVEVRLWKRKQRRNNEHRVYFYCLAMRNGWLPLPNHPSSSPRSARGFCLFTYFPHPWAFPTCYCPSCVFGWCDGAWGLQFSCHCCETRFRWWNCAAAHGGTLVSLQLSGMLRRNLPDERVCKCASLALTLKSSNRKSLS